MTRRRRRHLARRLAMAPVWFVVTAAVLGGAAIATAQRSGQAQLLTVVTGSMRPTLPPGSLVVVVPRDTASLRIGDVITFDRPGDATSTVTHRVVEVHGSGPNLGVRTRGDANPVDDPWTLQFTGGRTWVAVAHVPWLGRPWLWLADPGNRRLVLVPGVALITLMWLVAIWRRDGAPVTPVTPLDDALEGEAETVPAVPYRPRSARP